MKKMIVVIAALMLAALVAPSMGGGFQEFVPFGYRVRGPAVTAQVHVYSGNDTDILSFGGLRCGSILGGTSMNDPGPPWVWSNFASSDDFVGQIVDASVFYPTCTDLTGQYLIVAAHSFARIFGVNHSESRADCVFLSLVPE